MTLPAQPGILAAVPPVARYVTFHAVPHADRAALGAALQRIAQAADGGVALMGIGPSLAAAGCLWCPPVRDGGLDLRQLGL